ncbi:hypothetical protein AAFF_G00217310 [Aldrovandia affinis]|uniref:Uncharacterized protein n=1 Tax=Aldrovandia affinis TaxID=143900 RepID=A0AAD7SX00_9TELE|nr:hypothetical protein AAFF_G00217310 [Aldrovandia affinis]
MYPRLLQEPREIHYTWQAGMRSLGLPVAFRRQVLVYFYCPGNLQGSVQSGPSAVIRITSEVNRHTADYIMSSEFTLGSGQAQCVSAAWRDAFPYHARLPAT